MNLGLRLYKYTANISPPDVHCITVGSKTGTTAPVSPAPDKVATRLVAYTEAGRWSELGQPMAGPNWPNWPNSMGFFAGARPHLYHFLPISIRGNLRDEGLEGSSMIIIFMGTSKSRSNGNLTSRGRNSEQWGPVGFICSSGIQHLRPMAMRTMVTSR